MLFRKLKVEVKFIISAEPNHRRPKLALKSELRELTENAFLPAGLALDFRMRFAIRSVMTPEPRDARRVTSHCD